MSKIQLEQEPGGSVEHQGARMVGRSVKWSVKRAMVLVAVMTPIIVTSTKGQTFTRVTDFNNPIVTDAHANAYTGAAWFDYDLDGLLDLIVIGNGVNFLYHNEGGGAFSAVTGSAIVTDASAYRGVTCADYDNDGDPDCFLAGVDRSSLYRNDGGMFVRVADANMGTTDARGWSPAWGDYDDDGYLDLFIGFPAGFMGGGNRPNRLLHNDGPPNYTFTRVDTGILVSELDPYTSCNWSDYDQDGDLDMFIGSGPASSFAAPDNMYRNLLVENGVAGFERISDAPIATDPCDGQVMNLVDFDNDGDFDLHRTNWAAAMTTVMRRNDLYRNDGGVFVEITSGAIVTDQFVSLASLWEDFDNDGDLDCFVANVAVQDNFYRNDGGGAFTAIAAGEAAFGNFAHTGASAGDYDNDGDVDIFVVGHGSDQRSLLRNETANSNGWLQVRLDGVYSNSSAVGARVRVKATIGGEPVWQIREVSTQNSFLGHSSLVLHFGLGDASVVDSIQVLWPSGVTNDTTGVAINQQVELVEFCADSDGDGVACFDNCPDAANADQLDADGDGLGDVCDACVNNAENDGDADGLCGDIDNCPAVANADQTDTNSDGIGDACCCMNRGDVNGNGGASPNVADLTFMVNYLFKSGPGSPCPSEADVNANGVRNVADLTSLVNFLFKQGAAPVPCS